MLKKKSYKKLLILMIIIILLYFITSFYFVFKTDEEISMGLIQHSFSKIISIDSLDVHPPLYYLLLKLFLLITTFWTKSLLVKTIFARLFSFLCLILFLLCMLKLMNFCHIYRKHWLSIMFFLISPGVINESPKIRMYSLASCLLSFELYQLVKFIKSQKNLNLILATIFASLASYTIYPLAISAGLFILIYFIYDVYNKQVKNSIKLFVSGMIVILCYIPWIKIVIMQIRIHSETDGSLVPNYFYTITSSITQLNASSPTSPLLKYTCIASLFIILLFSYLIHYSYKNLNITFNNVLYVVLIDFVFTLFITVIFCKRQFRLTTIYPIYSILIFIIMSIIIKYINSMRDSRIIRGFILCLFAFFTLYSGLACLNNVKNYDIPSIHFINNYSQWKCNKNKNININKADGIKLVDHKIVGNSTFVTQDAVYLRPLNKNAVLKVNRNKGKEFISGLSNNKNNYNFFKKLYPNLKIGK